MVGNCQRRANCCLWRVLVRSSIETLTTSQKCAAQMCSISENHLCFCLTERTLKSVNSIVFIKKTTGKNYQASPWVYLNIAKVLEVPHKMAKALRKDRKGALNLYTVLEFPASAHITHKWWQHLYIKKHYYEGKKIHLKLLQLVV